jgi:hypothetical protein
MAGGSHVKTFICPNCNALYQVETKGHEIACRVCGVPLAGREGKFVLKYFLLREGIRRKHGGAKAT